MRMSFGDLIQSSKDIAIDDQSVSYTGMTSSLVFIKREINNTVSDLFTLMKEYRLEPPPKTLLTVANQVYYPYPPGLMKASSFTINLTTHTPEMKIVQSQEEWDRLQQIALTSGFPVRVFPRRDDFGIYPTPSDVFTVSIVGNYQPVRMTADDYTTGVVTVVNGDATVTTNGGTFTSSMVGRWFNLTGSTYSVPNGRWYRIASYNSPTSIELSRTFYESSESGRTYIIGESPELPEELHQFIPYRVGSIYWATRRQDSTKGQELNNEFYTGDFNNPRRRGSFTGGILATLNDLKNKGRGNSNLIETAGGTGNNYFENVAWTTTLTDSS